jgi:hypothetical protein
MPVITNVKQSRWSSQSRVINQSKKYAAAAMGINRPSAEPIR